jgi:hypothetical protein
MEGMIAGQGLVSPLGLGATEHALFVRASVGAQPPPAFETADGKRMRAKHCGFLGALLGSLFITERLSRMAEIAAHQALAPWEAVAETGPVALAFVAPRRPGITPEAVAATRSRVAKRARASRVETWLDAAGAFAALEQACAWLAAGDVMAVLVLGVDSFAHPAALEDDLTCAESTFCPSRPPPAEGAAAVLLVREDACRAHALVGARVLGCGTAVGRGNDDDDVIQDGLAMTGLVHALPERRIDLVSGQAKVDDLRAQDWHIASARMARRFATELQAITLENETGRLGAAAGVASMAFGVAALRHGVFRDLAPTAHLVAWAISRDGTRGLTLLQGAERESATEPRLLVAAHDRPQLRAVERDGFPIPDAEPVTVNEATSPPIEDEGAVTRSPLLDVKGASNDTGGEPPASPLSAEGTPDLVVRVAQGKDAPIPLLATYAEVVAACLDGIALAARHRALLPRASRAREREEERILAFLDALVVTPSFPSLLVAWWEEAAALPDPWKVWAPSFVLACLDGDDVSEALAGLWRQLAEDDTEAAAIAGEALALSPHPDRQAWTRRLSADTHPAVRAAALEALSLSGALEPDAILRALTSDEARIVRWMAMRATARLPADLSTDRRLDERLLDELHRAPDGELAFQATRALALRGNPAGYLAMQQDAALLERLGPYALEVLALLGSASDAPIARQVVARAGLTSKVLRGLGRYGHPGAAPVLLRALADEDAVEDASAALVWLFGLPFEEPKATSPEAFRAWLREAPLDEAVRYRFGKPYAPSCVTEAAARGTCSQADLAFLVDEANVREGLAERPALFRWSPEADAALLPSLAAFSKGGAELPRDTWRSAVRLGGSRP